MWTLNFLGKMEWMAPLLLRLFVGASFFAVHGYAKLHPGDEWDWGQGFATGPNAAAPAALMYLAAWTEFLGGFAMALGFLTRWAALGLAGVMAYAVFKVHWADGFPAPAGYEMAAVYAVGCLAVVFLGPGPLSLDRLFFGRDVMND